MSTTPGNGFATHYLQEMKSRSSLVSVYSLGFQTTLFSLTKDSVHLASLNDNLLVTPWSRDSTKNIIRWFVTQSFAAGRRLKRQGCWRGLASRFTPTLMRLLAPIQVSALWG